MKLLAALLTATLVLAGCGATGPAYDPGPRPDVGGSISGRVITAGDAAALSGRQVTAVNLATGRRYDVSTSTNGGYTVRVPVGAYRVEVELRSGETLVARPEAAIEIDRGDLDSARDFEIGLQSAAGSRQ
jgi:hypothetical protein